MFDLFIIKNLTNRFRGTNFVYNILQVYSTCFLVMFNERALKKEKRSKWFGSKNFDRSCRNHGGCPGCLANRMIRNNREKERMDFEVKELETPMSDKEIRILFNLHNILFNS